MLQTTLIVQFDTAVTGVKTISFDVEVNQVDLCMFLQGALNCILGALADRTLRI